MMIAAITMVYRDYWALSQWYAHYAGKIGAKNLFIIAHGADPEIAEICPDASIITIPRRDLSHFDTRRGVMLNAFQNSLLSVYDWVIRTDADELICLDPAHHENFADLFTKHAKSKALFSLGMDLFQSDNDTKLGPTDRALENRRAAQFSGHYSKAWAVSDRVGLIRHGVQVRPRRVSKFYFNLPSGVYLVHLKYANLTALENANKHRMKIATGPGKGLPGSAWREAATKDHARLCTARALPYEPWDEVVDHVYRTVCEDPVRGKEKNIVRARSVRFDFRTTLPDWFQNL